MESVFFYGLFMDQGLLRDKGLDPQNCRHALLEGYQLQIGERATLSPLEGAYTYGIVMDLSNEGLETLYGSDGVEDYVPHRVQATTLSGEPLSAISYILPAKQISGSNSQYAADLALLAEKLDLPESYVKEIKAWIRPDI